MQGREHTHDDDIAEGEQRNRHVLLIGWQAPGCVSVAPEGSSGDPPPNLVCIVRLDQQQQQWQQQQQPAAAAVAAAAAAAADGGVWVWGIGARADPPWSPGDQGSRIPFLGSHVRVQQPDREAGPPGGAAGPEQAPICHAVHNELRRLKQAADGRGRVAGQVACR